MNGTEAWHALKNHANVATEAARGQIALTEDEFELIPDILSSPNDIQLSKDRDAFGRPALIFTKKIGDKYVTIQGYSKGKQGLVFDSMWKIKGKPPVTANIDSNANQSQTSKTSAGTASIRNIPHPFEKSKGETAADFSDGTDELLDLKGGAARDTLNLTDIWRDSGGQDGRALIRNADHESTRCKMGYNFTRKCRGKNTGISHYSALFPTHLCHHLLRRRRKFPSSPSSPRL